MTLFRKGLIRYYTHGLWYTGALFMSLYYMTSAMPGYWFWCKIATVFSMRVKLGMDKYVIWVIFAIFNIPECEQFFVDAVKSLLNV
jgi:hypothetical protein